MMSDNRISPTSTPTERQHALSDEALQRLANGIAAHLHRHYAITLVVPGENALDFARAAWSASPGPGMGEALRTALDYLKRDACVRSSGMMTALLCSMINDALQPVERGGVDLGVSFDLEDIDRDHEAARVIDPEAFERSNDVSGLEHWERAARRKKAVAKLDRIKAILSAPPSDVALGGGGE